MNRSVKLFKTGVTCLATLTVLFSLGCSDYTDEGGKPEEIKWNTTNKRPFFASGSTFVAPLISRWATDYEIAQPVHVNYQPIGSGAGIANLRKGIGAFAASDAPLTDEQLKGLPPIVQVPVTAGPLCVIYSLPGLNVPLRLSGKTLAGIYGGDIISWQDASIAKDNPGVKLPHAAIIVVHRSDASGTTSILTSYLSKVSAGWMARYGQGLTVKWPAGIAGEGSEAVLNTVRDNPGTIGYLELGYAIRANVPVASILNQAGEYVAPSTQTAFTAVNDAVDELSKDVRTPIVDPPASSKGAYPITGLSFFLIPKDNQHSDGEQAALKGFVAYSLTKGQNAADQMSYARLPAPVQRQGEIALAQLTQNGNSLK